MSVWHCSVVSVQLIDEQTGHADDDCDTAEQDDGHEAMDTMDEGADEAMPAHDQDIVEEEQEQAEPMQEDKAPPCVHPAGRTGELQGAQGTPKALASTLVLTADTTPSRPESVGIAAN